VISVEKLIISGSRPLEGKIQVKGAKNAALKIFPLALLTKEPILITNLPEIEDCQRAKEMLTALGHRVKKIKHGTVEIQFKNKTCINLSADLVNKFRASIMFVGPLLASCQEVYFPHPGGCVIGAGTRPIDMFLDSFAKKLLNIRIFLRFGVRGISVYTGWSRPNTGRVILAREIFSRFFQRFCFFSCLSECPSYSVFNFPFADY